MVNDVAALAAYIDFLIVNGIFFVETVQYDSGTFLQTKEDKTLETLAFNLAVSICIHCFI